MRNLRYDFVRRGKQNLFGNRSKMANTEFNPVNLSNLTPEQRLVLFESFITYILFTERYDRSLSVDENIAFAKTLEKKYRSEFFDELKKHL